MLKLKFKYMNRAGNFNLIDSRLNTVAMRSHAVIGETNANCKYDEGPLIDMM